MENYTMNKHISDLLSTLMIAQYRNIGQTPVQEDIDAIRDAATQGLEEFGEVCHRIFGISLGVALFNAITIVYEQNKAAYQNRKDIDPLDSVSVQSALMVADTNADVARLLLRIIKKYDRRFLDQSKTFSKRAGYYKTWLHERIDPENNHPQNKTDPTAYPHQRDYDRDEYIYKARKIDHRTFADIGRELGIGGNRVAQVYHRVDSARNGRNAEHWQPDYPKRDIIVRGERIKRNQNNVIAIPKNEE